MMADYQVLFNLAVGVLGVAGGLLLNVLWASLKDLRQADNAEVGVSGVQFRGLMRRKTAVSQEWLQGSGRKGFG